MDEIVEKVARAIAIARLDEETRAGVDVDNWVLFESDFEQARAAIAALLEGSRFRDLGDFVAERKGKE